MLGTVLGIFIPIRSHLTSPKPWLLTVGYMEFSKVFFNRMINLLLFLAEMWYWVFLWALFSSLFVHGAAGVLMFVMLQRHRQGRVISVIAISVGFLASVTGAMITSKLILFCLKTEFYMHYSLGNFVPLKMSL